MNVLMAILKEMTGAPVEFQVLPEGKIDINGDAPAYLDEAAAQTIIKAFKARGNDIVIDYEHQTIEGVQAPAAGWIKDIIWKGKEGLHVLVEWTKRAKEYLENREYRYFSPVMLVSKENRIVVELLSVALTNTPKINNLKPIMAKFDANKSHKNKEDNMIVKLKKLLKLADDAGEDKIIEAVTLSINKVNELTDQAGNQVACKEVMEALGAKDGAGKDEVIQIVASLKAPADVAKTLSLEVAQLKTEIASMKQEDLVALALKEGKTSPDELDKWGRKLALSAPEQFKIIVLSRPVGSVIPVTDTIIAKDNKGGGLDDSQRKINEMCGVNDETYQKYNK